MTHRFSTPFAIGMALIALAALVAGCGGHPRSIGGKDAAQWVADLKNEDQKTRESAKSNLRLMGPHSVAPLAEAFQNEKNGEHKVLLAELLAKVGEFAEEAVPALVDGLQSDDEKIRKASVSALASIGTPSVPNLCELARNDDPLKRRHALEVLAEIGPKAGRCVATVTGIFASCTAENKVVAARALGRTGPRNNEAINALRNAVTDDDPSVRKAAILALGQTRSGHRATADVLVKALDDDDAIVRAAAAQSLGRLDEDARPTREALLKKIEDPSGEVRAQVVMSLVSLDIGPEEAINALVKALKSLDGAELKTLAKAISTFAVPGTAKIDKELLDVLKWIGSLYLGNDTKRDTARMVVVKLGGKTVPYLRVMLKGKDTDVRIAATDVLAELGPRAQDAVDDLTQALADKDARVRAGAACSLGAIGPAARPSIERLIECAKDESPAARAEAIMALALLGPKPEQALPVLQDALNDPEGDVVGKAATAIAAFGSDGSPAGESLAGAVVGDDGVRWPVMVALDEIGALVSLGVPALTKALNDETVQVRRDAAKMLGLLGTQAVKAIGPLVAVLADEDEKVRANAAWALGELNAPAATAAGPLKEVVDGKGNVARLRALEALHKIDATPANATSVVLSILESVVNRLSDDRNMNLLIWASTLLNDLGEKATAVVPVLAKALERNVLMAEDATLLRIMKTMRNLGPKEESAIPALIAVLDEEPEAPVFVAAAEYLSSFGSKAADGMEALLLGLEAENFPLIREAACKAVGEIGTDDPEVIDLLKKLKDGDKEQTVKDAALAALTRLGK